MEMFIATSLINYLSYPSIKPQIHGKPSRKWAAMASAMHSAKQGENARRTTANESFLSAAGSNPRPALMRMMVRAICLQATTLKNTDYYFVTK